MPNDRDEPGFDDYLDRLNAHYEAATASQGETLLARLQEAFRAAGSDPYRLSLDDVAGVDQLHLGGRRASRALAALGELRGGERVLDVGCGTGGASRLLAAEYGCDVVGVDITPAFIEVANWLSLATGLADHTRFVCADAADVPLAAGSLEVVWCQHALMNMPHVPRVLAEWQRLLVSEGRVLLHELVAGDNHEPLALPVPWAREQATSHLRSRDQLERVMALAGFEPLGVEDVTDAALAWRQEHSRRESGADEAAREAGSLPGPGLIFGSEFARMGRNLRDNLVADKVRVLAGSWQRGQR
ncbi:methyltransferase domain-containing protein [Billgrantia diversa]|uniref:class I SAM-dependent methyltransferase n=1 Tax=Halomonas sp. MCCC 1A13316 TaxID=2733487 RepID=UPI0018A394CC|nr:class I SAM-dependent methyltransferase [Halomonas sp. MCCC 1A13316]QOR39913.1 methyltransferase domain-containing protein [Halomonas sp. MCCC 1A13316]